jgi:Heterokaryon incompatibility protein (HET)
MRPYQYSALNEEAQEIRLLALLPGEVTSPIQIEILKAPFDPDSNSIPIFEALSYAWGSTENPVAITVGTTDEFFLSVTHNLATALPCLRYEDRSRVLWIDAICVNQQDLDERSSQVKRMGEIYPLAHRVVVWLGPEENDSSLAFKILQSLGSQVEVDWEAKTIVDPTNRLSWVAEGQILPISELQLRAIYLLLMRPWFERLWVRQEILLARENAIMACGNIIVPFQIFRNAIFCLGTSLTRTYLSPQEQSLFIKRHNLVYSLCAARHRRVTFSENIRISSECKCSDPRYELQDFRILGPLVPFETRNHVKRKQARILLSS